ncbi:MAG: hypothetical protein LBV55_02340 [Acholeplasmatales bacterium]|jgi:hypothetical protein|nr:hypothetical protein [Acholeplasmatales bacterium]
MSVTRYYCTGSSGFVVNGYSTVSLGSVISAYVNNLKIYQYKSSNNGLGYYKSGNSDRLSDYSPVFLGFYYIEGSHWEESTSPRTYYAHRNLFLNSKIKIESKILFGNYKVLGFGEEEPVYKVKFANDINFYLVLGISL